MEEENFKIIKTAKDRPCLLLNGFKYCYQLKNKSGTVNFRCSNRNMCSASLTMNSEMTTVCRVSEHTCLPDFDRNSIEWAMFTCKEKAAGSFEPIQPIFEESLQDLAHLHHSILLPTFASKKDSIYAWKKKFLGTDSLKFDRIKDVELPKIVSDNFLIAENGDDDDKLFIFCSESSRKILKKTYRFLGDGTFKVVPKPFHQLYTIHAILNYESDSSRTIVPVIYALLPDKQEKTYVRLFQTLKRVMNIQIQHYKADFELAALNAVSHVFPAVKKTGCYLHFIKGIWKKSKQMDISTEDDGKRFVRYLTYLPLLPVEYIEEAWRTLITTFSNVKNIQKFQKYFEKYWFTTVTPTLFGCSDEKYRTTNNLEGWHNRLNKKLSKKPNIFKFLYTLRLEAKHYDVIIKQACAHRATKKSRKVDLKYDQHVKNLVTDVKNKSIGIIDFFRKASHLSYERHVNAQLFGNQNNKSESDSSSSESSSSSSSADSSNDSLSDSESEIITTNDIIEALDELQ